MSLHAIMRDGLQRCATEAGSCSSLHIVAHDCMVFEGRMGWQKASGYNNARVRAEAAISRYKRVIGNGLRSRTERRRAADVDVGVHALNRMLDLGRPSYVRLA